jgi:hypothetical protein
MSAWEDPPCDSTILGVPLAREGTLWSATQLGALSEALRIRYKTLSYLSVTCLLWLVI